jgi:8-oxo-dGTP pyrophosphatase MutT (NUDIX family)
MGESMETTEATICHILNGNRILLKQATRGISKGMWNGAGGKIEPGEAPEESVAREVLEETGLKIKDVRKHGIIHFRYIDQAEGPSKVHLFSTRSFTGKIKSTEEGEVRWFDIDKVPLDQMWDDDRYWLPLFLAGRDFDSEFYFDNKKVRKYSITFK